MTNLIAAQDLAIAAITTARRKGPGQRKVRGLRMAHAQRTFRANTKALGFTGEQRDAAWNDACDMAVLALTCEQA